MPATLTCREACTEAILHDHHTVLGLRLKPFCLEMWLILIALESPLVAGGPVTMADLQLAAVACATNSIDNFYAASRHPNWRWQLWWIVSRGYSFKREFEAFNRYIDDYCPNFPRWNFDGIAPEPTKCPDVMVCAAKLIDRGHSTHLVKREMGLGEILAWNLAIDESRGKPLDTIQGEADLNPPPEQLEAFYAGC